MQRNCHNCSQCCMRVGGISDECIVRLSLWAYQMRNVHTCHKSWMSGRLRLLEALQHNVKRGHVARRQHLDLDRSIHCRSWRACVYVLLC